MNPWHVVMVVGIALAIVGLTVLAVVRYLKATTVEWLPLTQLHDWQYSAPAGFDLGFLRAAIEKAQECLVHTGWSAQAIVDATSNVRVLVNSEVRWVDGWGRRIAGMADVETGSVEVGRDLSALCHELGHLCLWRIDGVRDDEHGARWQARGIERAISAYLAWLQAR